jgi:hypothetical protein
MMGRRVARGCIGRSHLGAIACGALVAAACGNDPPTLGGGTGTDGTGSSSSPQTSTLEPDVSTGGDAATQGASADADTAAPETGAASSDGATESEGGGRAAEGCCEPHASPSCDEPEVAECVCASNAACCAFAWDRACAAAAVESCAAVCGDDPTGDTGSAGACDRVVQIELDATAATLSGGWQLAMSMLGEGQIAALSPGQFDGSVLWEPDIPCDDAWTIWVRYFEEGGDDSYYVTLDGQPDPAAVFEGDCTAAGEGWGWARLNWRDEATQGACEYTEDPWSPTWTAGTHAIDVSYRETIAIARIVVTNDETFTP